MNDFQGFLHRHPRLEMELNLDSEHVIVDKSDWKIIHMMYNKIESKELNYEDNI